jgi:hypothetical protein
MNIFKNMISFFFNYGILVFMSRLMTKTVVTIGKSFPIIIASPSFTLLLSRYSSKTGGNQIQWLNSNNAIEHINNLMGAIHGSRGAGVIEQLMKTGNAALDKRLMVYAGPDYRVEVGYWGANKWSDHDIVDYRAQLKIFLMLMAVWESDIEWCADIRNNDTHCIALRRLLEHTADMLSEGTARALLDELA